MAKIIGITGTLRAGKGTVAEYLVKAYGFKHLSVRKYLEEQLALKGAPADRDNLVRLANEIRAKHGAEFIVMQLYQVALSSGQDCVIESVRTEGEVEALRQLEGFELWAVDADLRIRHRRNLAETTGTDQRTLEQFIADEQREMSSTDKTKQNIGRCIELADVVFTNNGSKEDLFSAIESKLGTQKVNS